MRLLRLALVVALAPAAAFAADHHVAVGPDLTFNPSDITIAPGDRVIWTRMGGTHNVRADDGSWGNAVSGSWTTFDRVFPSTGNFEYYCEAHSTPNGNDMNGIVRVQGGGGTPGSLRFSAATATIGEGGGQVTLTVQRTGGDDGAVSVEYFTADGSATFPGGDYVQTNGVLNWADNDDDNKTFVVPITNDTAQEGSESFTVTLESPGGGATIVAPSTVTVTITDNDGGGGSAGTIRFTQGAQSVAEGAGTVTFTVERTGGTSGPVGVSYATANGTASAPGDYASAGSTLSWASGDGANKTFVVSVVDDSENEGSETFTATLSAPTGGASLGSPSTSTATINDDDTSCTPSTCVTSANQLCLAGGSGTPGRFRVTVTWTDFQGNSGQGVALAYTADSGFFYFFQPEILELLVKVVNGCGFNDAYWFFNAAASNVRLVYTVTDLQTCQTETVNNPLGTFASNGDIQFFASSCP